MNKITYATPQDMVTPPPGMFVSKYYRCKLTNKLRLRERPILLKSRKKPITTEVEVEVAKPTEAPAPPPTSIDSVPTSLIELWKQKLPILNHIRMFQGLPYFYDPNYNPFYNSMTQNAPANKLPDKIIWRPGATYLGSQYPWPNSVSVYQPIAYEANYNAGVPVAFEDRFAYWVAGHDPTTFNPLNYYLNPLEKLFAVVSATIEMRIGGDPEFFSPTKPPTKSKQQMSFVDGGGYLWEADGYAWEYHPPTDRCMNNIMSKASYEFEEATRAKQLLATPRLDITPELEALVSDDQKKLGCNPSYNVYGLVGDLETASTLPVRWAGGHLHFELPRSHRNDETVMLAVKNLDAIMSTASVCMYGHLDDAERRKYYGLVGEYRTKPYGFEYRTPSNQLWISSLHYYVLVEIARLCVKLAVYGLSFEDIGFDTTEQEVIACVQTNNQQLAEAIVRRNLLVYKSVFGCKQHMAGAGCTPLQLLLREHSRLQLTDTKTKTLKSVFGPRLLVTELVADQRTAANYAHMYTPMSVEEANASKL